jgi:hypothetical protein
MASVLLFVLVALLATNIITNAFPDNAFDRVRDDATTISQHLMTQGKPALWNDNNVIRIGIMEQRNRVNPAKLDALRRMNYDDTRDAFGTPYDYALYFTENATIQPVTDTCIIGSAAPTVTKTTSTTTVDVAYLARDDTRLQANITAWNGTVYDAADETAAFFDDLDDYTVAVLENPELQTTTSYTEAQQRTTLDNWVRHGGTLYITGNASLNVTGVGFATTDEHDAITTDAPPYGFTNGSTITDTDTIDTSYVVTDLTTDGFTSLASYNTTGAFAATWNYSLGTAHYIATLDATYAGDPLSDAVTNAIEADVVTPTADCTDVSFTMDTSAIANVERLVVRDGAIQTMRVVTWT